MHKLAAFLARGGIANAARGRMRALHDGALLYLGLALLGAICLGWLPFALLLDRVLPPRAGRPVGRFAIMAGFRLYLALLTVLGGGRFDLAALDALADEPGLVIAPNHPSLLDAVLIVSRLPGVVCIMKAALMHNLFLGAGARLAGYIGNDSVRRMIAGAVAALAAGNHLLLFPEGTRTTHAPVDPFQGSIALIARRAGVPVQTVFIETDSDFLGKGKPLLRRVPLPLRYRVRLGRRFAPDLEALDVELEAYFRAELSASPSRSPTHEYPPPASTGPDPEL
jgi:1-acyl-sn-glycerol-3-phosphate acyltransferase